MRVRDAYLQEVLEGRAFLLFDGAMGTMLQASGLPLGDLPELLNFSNPSLIQDVHRAYVDAGSQVVTTNTFGANARKLGDAASVADVFAAAVSCARASGARYVAADVGPTGGLLKPLGDMDFEEAYELFAQQARAIEATDADIVVVETMADLLEMKAAVLALKEYCTLPIFATMTFGEDGRTFLGTTPECAAITLSALGVSALGINCSLGPSALAELIARMAPFARIPLMVQANAGLPHVENGVTVFDIGPDEYSEAAVHLVEAGATILGGCCGTSPAHIARLSALLADAAVPSSSYRGDFAISNAQHTVVLEAGSSQIAVVGERINPTGKPKLKEALRAGNVDYVLGQALEQAELGADILDVNLGLPEIDEAAMMLQVTSALQTACPLPLQIDSGDPRVIEAAVRCYSGKALVNSVNAKRESLETILPLAKKYGCAVVGLTLDENGIPSSAQGRFALAKRIVEAAQEYGIPREDILIDCLTLSASTNQNQVQETLRALSRVKSELGVRTTLGVSNISFGLPQRDLLNSTFLAAAFGAGLDVPIINPRSARYRDAIAAQRVLNGQDEMAAGFIDAYAGWSDPYAVSAGRSGAGRGGVGRGVAACSGACGGAGFAVGVSASGGGTGRSGAGFTAGSSALVGLGSAAGVSASECDGLQASAGEDAAAWQSTTQQSTMQRSVIQQGAAVQQGASIQQNVTAAARQGATVQQGAAAQQGTAATARQGAVFASSSLGEVTTEPEHAVTPLDGADLSHAVLTGRKAQIAGLTNALLEEHEALDVINNYFIPILDKVGDLYERGEFFLPQLMSSAEAVKIGFDVVKERSSAVQTADKGRIILATVEGDIHDIGKNIVKMLMENYGFEVIDLGRDVAPEAVLSSVREYGVRLVGLSALMTTTVKSMEETIELLHAEEPECKVMVGGAVLNPEYAEMIGADFYTKDAAAAARLAERFFAGEL